MATFTGTALSDIITPGFVSPSVLTDGAAFPGSGSDTITGGLGDDTLGGGGGDDLISGGDGNDIARLGAGNDRFTWAPGDDNDIVEGQAGIDTLDFLGANAAENIDIAANGSRLRFFRDIANVTIDLSGMETLLYHALGGADTITVNALTGTDAKRIFINLEGALGSGTGDAQTDTVRILGAASGENITVAGVGSTVSIKGLPWLVKVSNLEASDAVQVFGNGGRDTIDARRAVVGAHQLQLDGGGGNDTIIGSVNGDVIVGGDGRDHVRGGGGNDVALLGAADDVYTWKSGDGNDVIEGQDGEDRLQFAGGGASDSLSVSANSGRCLVSSSIDAALLDIDDVEHLSVRAGAGSDSLAVFDMTGTDVGRIDIDLFEKRGSRSPDTVTVAGAATGDTVVLSLAKGAVSIGGLSATTAIGGANAQDRLVINGFLGEDLIDASNLPAVSMQLDFRGGDGNDSLLGSGGDDRFLWAPGDDNDTINGRGGNDLLDFSGANAAEVINFLSNGQQLQLLRNIANVQMITNAVERFQFHAAGASDTIFIDDLSGTSAKLVNLDLASVPGTGIGDGQADSIFVLGRAAADNVSVSGTTSNFKIEGMPWRVSVAAREAGDLVVLSTGAGADTIDIKNLGAGTGIRIDSGQGNDVLVAGSAADQFLFSTALDATSNVDRIRFFSASDDLILLDDAVFAGIGAPGGLAASAFHAGSAATDALQRIVYDGSNGRLFFDNDGAGGNDAVLFAKLEPGLTLTENSFLVV